MSSIISFEEFNNQLKHAAFLNKIDIEENFSNSVYRYFCLLMEWNSKFNMTAHTSVTDFIFKDVIDQLLAFKKISPYLSDSHNIVDIGAGAGFTGIILSLYYTTNNITFLDKNKKKINFIRHCCLELGIKAKFINCSLDLLKNASIPTFDLVLSRATWNISVFLNYVQNYVQNNAYAIYFGGPQQLFNVKQAHQSLEFKDELQYTILPYNYNRKLFIFKKINSFT